MGVGEAVVVVLCVLPPAPIQRFCGRSITASATVFQTVDAGSTPIVRSRPTFYVIAPPVQTTTYGKYGKVTHHHPTLPTVGLLESCPSGRRGHPAKVLTGAPC